MTTLAQDEVLHLGKINKDPILIPGQDRGVTNCEVRGPGGGTWSAQLHAPLVAHKGQQTFRNFNACRGISLLGSYYTHLDHLTVWPPEKSGYEPDFLIDVDPLVEWDKAQYPFHPGAPSCITATVLHVCHARSFQAYNLGNSNLGAFTLERWRELAVIDTRPNQGAVVGVAPRIEHDDNHAEFHLHGNVVLLYPQITVARVVIHEDVPANAGVIHPSFDPDYGQVVDMRRKSAPTSTLIRRLMERIRA